jgi:DNA polymerase-3 subunit gamma/tau
MPMFVAVNEQSPVVRVEIKDYKESKAIVKPIEKKGAVISKLSKGNFRSPHSLDELMNSEKSKDGLSDELIGGEDMPKTPFGQEQLDEHWKLFVTNHIDKKNRSLFTTLNQRTPELKPHFKLLFPIENHVQLNQIDSIKVDLVNYLRKHLNNYSISFETPVRKIESKVHIYTDEEKYKVLAKKYPLLEKLREKLDLDLNH